jgi:hypothetical protein
MRSASAPSIFPAEREGISSLTTILLDRAATRLFMFEFVRPTARCTSREDRERRIEGARPRWAPST